MQDRPGDLLFAVFGETHVAGHYCWSAGLRGDRETHDSPMYQVYAALDRVLGATDAMKPAPKPPSSSYPAIAVGPNHAGWHLLPELLERLGLAGTVEASSAAAGNRQPRGRFDPVKAIRDLLPKDFRKNLARRLPTRLRDKLAQRVDTADIDWSRTRAFCLPTDLEGYVRINLRGREPQGIVVARPGIRADSRAD